MPYPSMNVHTYTHTCTHTHTHRSGWCASSPASLHLCDSIIDDQVLKQKCLHPLHFLHFFPLLLLYGVFTVLFVAWPFRREMCIPLSLPFVWISPFFLSHSLLWHGLSTAFTDSPLTQISPLPGGLKTQSRSQPALLVLEDFSCFPLRSLRGFLQPPPILFDQVSELWAASQGSVVGMDIRDCSSQWICMYKWPQTILLPFLQDSSAAALLFCPEKNCPKNFFGKEVEGGNPCPFWILWNHPEKPPCRSSVSGNLWEQQVFFQQIQIYRKTFVKCPAISS